MKQIGKLESDEGEKFRVRRQKEGSRKKNHPRVPVIVEMFDYTRNQWNEISKFDGETEKSRQKGMTFVTRKTDLEIMREAREEADWVAKGEVFLSQRWAEKEAHTY